MSLKVIYSHLLTVCERAKLCLRIGWVTLFPPGVIAALGLSIACGSEPQIGKVLPSYDTFTSSLMQLSADLNGDGRIDQRTYMDGNRPLRGEADVDGDGRVDRWEYFDNRAALVRVGTSSRNDGIEDTWTWATPAPDGVRRVSLSTMRDRHVDREEYFQGTVLIRDENDTNADGRIDQWEIFENGALREARFDTSFTRGRADRRLLYDVRGQLTGIEADDDGDGRFERAVASPADLASQAPRPGTKP